MQNSHVLKGGAVGYLASEYPAVSHTFIFREIQALRERGLEVKTASIHTPKHEMCPEDVAESANTYYIMLQSIWKMAWLNTVNVIKDPAAAWRMFRYALSLRRKGPVKFFLLLGYYMEAGALVAWAEHENVRHVHVHFANPAATVAMVAAASGKIDFSMSVHGPDVFYDVPGNLLAEKARQASFVRCISHYCRSQLMRIMDRDQWDKLNIVRCGIDTEQFGPRPCPNNEIVQIICVGRLVPAKAQHLLLEACRILCDRGHDLHLTLVGDGSDRESLKLQALQSCMSSKVTFTLSVTPAQVAEYLDQADLMVLPSFAEGLPVVLMEAMAKEVPCVSTRIMGIPELIEHDLNGLLTAPSDLDDLVNQMERLITDVQLRRRLGQQARKKVVEQFSIEETGDRMLALFKQHAITEAS